MTPKPRRPRLDSARQLNAARAMGDEHAPFWVEPAEAARGNSGVPLNTLRSWARRGVVSSVCCRQTGRLLINLTEVEEVRMRRLLAEQARFLQRTAGASQRVA